MIHVVGYSYSLSVSLACNDSCCWLLFSSALFSVLYRCITLRSTRFTVMYSITLRSTKSVAPTTRDVTLMQPSRTSQNGSRTTRRLTRRCVSIWIENYPLLEFLISLSFTSITSPVSHNVSFYLWKLILEI